MTNYVKDQVGPATRNRELPVAIDNLEAAVSMLEEKVRKLNVQLSPVLDRDLGHGEGSSPDGKASMERIYAEDVQNLSTRVHKLGESLSTLMDRLHV